MILQPNRAPKAPAGCHVRIYRDRELVGAGVVRSSSRERIYLSEGWCAWSKIDWGRDADGRYWSWLVVNRASYLRALEKLGVKL